MDFKHYFLLRENQKKQKVKNVVDGQNLILFFSKGSALYGAPEESRVVFARMKNPDDETPENWADDANFMAFDLGQALLGQKVQNIFSNKDLDDINIIDKDDCEERLMKLPEPDVFLPVKQDAGVIKLKDRKK